MCHRSEPKFSQNIRPFTLATFNSYSFPFGLFKMKLKLDAIQAKYMPLTMQGQPAKQPVLKIVAGDFEATTSRLHLDLAFPVIINV